jgi:NCS1 family nucleobase:cation symporter-1
VFGANVPAVMRALVACGWFGINTWVGGRALQAFFRSIWPAWETFLGNKVGSCDPIAKDYIGHPCSTTEWLTTGHVPTEWVSFMLFWALNILIVYKGMELVRKLENLAAPFVLIMTAALLVWAVKNAHGFGALLEDQGKYPTFRAFWPIFVPSVTAMVGFWATLSLNMPDFTRFGRSQREQTIGQIVALPSTMTVFSLMAIIITSASSKIFGEPIWDPIDLASHFTSRLIVGTAMFTVVVATLGVNIAANVVSPANDFANLLPGKISFRTGGLITGIIGVLMLPWKLIADPNGYIFKWLLGYSGGLGSIAGVLVVDYWLMRNKRLAVADLYRREGGYQKWRWQGIAATLAGCVAAWIGLVVPFLRPLYNYAWFVGAGVAGLAYFVTSDDLRLAPGVNRDAKRP